VSPSTIATEQVWSEPDEFGVRRLLATPGMVVPTTPPVYGITTPKPNPAAGTLPFADYDTLTEAQLIERLADLSADELEHVRAYEQAHQARGAITRYGLTSTVVTGTKTELTPPAQSTSEGYTAMKATDLQAEADRRGLTVTGTGANGNIVKDDLVAALQTDDAAKATQD
jgi:hypothetical protein